MYLAIVDVTPEGRVAKYQDYPAEAEAQSHADRVRDDYPDVFVIEASAGVGVLDLVIDTAAGTARVEMRPVEPAKESEILLALRDLADDLGPQHAAKINARFGRRPA